MFLNLKNFFSKLSRTQVLALIFIIQMTLQSIFIPYYFSLYGAGEKIVTLNPDSVR